MYDSFVGPEAFYDRMVAPSAFAVPHGAGNLGQSGNVGRLGKAALAFSALQVLNLSSMQRLGDEDLTAIAARTGGRLREVRSVLARPLVSPDISNKTRDMSI